MGRKFAVVEFEDENVLGVVPYKWISPMQSTCRWPCIVSSLKMQKALEGLEDIEHLSYTSVPIEVLAVASTYKLAKIKANDLQEKKQVDSVDNEKEICAKKKRQRVSIAEIEADSEIEVSDVETSNTFIPQPSVADISTHIDCSRDGIGAGVYKKIFNMLEEIAFDLKHLSEKVDENTLMLQKALQYKEEIQNEYSYLDKFFPIKSHEELTSFEERMKDEVEASKVVAALSRVGGMTYKTLTFNIMLKVLSKGMALKFSYYGRQHKKAFKDFILSRLVIRAVLQAQSMATEDEVSKRIGTFLATAGDREGGRKSRNK